MCEHCGCNQPSGFSVTGPEPGQAVHWHTHTDAHGRVYAHAHPDRPGHTHTHDAHAHDPAAAHSRAIAAAESVLAHNLKLAAENRALFKAKEITAVNLVSSPGAGKTTLIEATLDRLRNKVRCAVIVGDLATQRDAERIRKHGVQAVQVTTGTVCHLDAQMVAAALEQLHLDGLELLFIENVGNLVCPASYDLGEDVRVVLLPVTEGEDKPLKYPPIFHTSAAVVITKTDLAAPAGFDINAARANIARVAPHARVIELSARSGSGMDAWIEFLEKFLHKQRH
ncbi:MAG: hydrogenase nickel incorporation protein HypB [Verrucomicrobiae bacterium]|nr:hydrogenase nickel incorporation protein HypB [Verrucomicrobiae bacterium]MDW7979503.1 hydrogenase nickel incorporation protein HypB [Verrucomicrobiales bacterium]